MLPGPLTRNIAKESAAGRAAAVRTGRSMRKVVKFGGSSLADAGQFRKVEAIVKADESRLYVVPSAPGRRFDGDTKVTDLLIEAYRIAVEG